MENLLLINSNVRVVFVQPKFGKPFIQWFDLKDQWNAYQGFTRNVRGLGKAAEFLKKISTDERLKDDVTMGDITKILSKANLKPHTFCGMD